MSTRKKQTEPRKKIARAHPLDIKLKMIRMRLDRLEKRLGLS